jgi:hypothetical protein
MSAPGRDTYHRTTRHARRPRRPQMNSQSLPLRRRVISAFLRHLKKPPCSATAATTIGFPLKPTAGPRATCQHAPEASVRA